MANEQGLLLANNLKRTTALLARNIHSAFEDDRLEFYEIAMALQLAGSLATMIISNIKKNPETVKELIYVLENYNFCEGTEDGM
jgi:hypothetical protein